MVDSQAVPPIPIGHFAFFFDFDGTLVEIKPRPEDVYLPAPIRALLKRLAVVSEGALALISGRSMDELASMVSPLDLPLAGVHGAERRDINGREQRVTLPAEDISALHGALIQGLIPLTGVTLETKGNAFALHYRQAPRHEMSIMALAKALVGRFSGLDLQPGKCVVEIRPQGINKGNAIAAFLREAPFAGRLPVFLGDDLTDEDGFNAVNTAGGLTIKVGAGETNARWRINNVNTVHAWLEQTVIRNEQRKRSSHLQEADYESFSCSL